MKKILFHLHSLGLGGAERVVVNLSEQFAGDGYQVIIALEVKAKEEYNLPSGVEKAYVGLDGQEKGRISSFVKRIGNLRAFIHKEKPDVVIAFMKSANYRALMATRGMKIPVIVSVRNDPRQDYSSRSCRIMNKLFMNRASWCIFQTEDAQQFFDERLQKKSQIILNPIHDKYLQTEDTPPMRKEIVSVGRLSAQKNHKLLIKAFAKLTDKYPEYVLKLYGGKASLYTNDTTGEELEELVQELHLEDRVKFQGVCNDLEQRLPGAACFVLPSNYEGMPNVVLEAMAMGLPVISTDCPCGGPRMLIHSGENGLLVPVGDESALVEAMDQMLGNPEFAQKCGLRAKKIRELANTRVIYRQWKTCVEKVCEENRA